MNVAHAEVTEFDIRRVLRDPGAMRIHFQPVADLRLGSVAGYEVLARFGAVRPDAWFAAAEVAGLGARADRAVVGRALEASQSLPQNTFLTINVGPDSLSDPVFDDVREGRFDLRGIVFEITEHQRVDDYVRLTKATDALRGHGAMIAVDDAGAGYASMRHVLALRPQFVKVDREFVSGCDRDGARAALIEALGAYAGRLDAWVIAEGVETAGELRTLMELGVPLAQGFLFGEAGDGWSALHPEAIAAVRFQAGGLAQPMAGCTVRALGLAASGTVRVEEGGVAWIVQLDEWMRPLDLGVEGGGLAEAMRVGAATMPAIALVRAMGRPPETRYLPLAVTGETGALIGLAPIDRLIHAALGS